MGSECKNCGNELTSVCMQCHACMGCKEPTSQAARIAELEATERELREALKVLAETICKVGFADQCEPHCNTRSVVEGRKCSCGGERRCKRKMEKMWANPIAADAVREAGA